MPSGQGRSCTGESLDRFRVLGKTNAGGIPRRRRRRSAEAGARPRPALGDHAAARAAIVDEWDRLLAEAAREEVTVSGQVVELLTTSMFDGMARQVKVCWLRGKGHGVETANPLNASNVSRPEVTLTATTTSYPSSIRSPT